MEQSAHPNLGGVTKTGVGLENTHAAATIPNATKTERTCAVGLTIKQVIWEYFEHCSFVPIFRERLSGARQYSAWSMDVQRTESAPAGDRRLGL